jgi:hypothetical protein
VCRSGGGGGGGGGRRESSRPPAQLTTRHDTAHGTMGFKWPKARLTAGQSGYEVTDLADVVLIPGRQHGKRRLPAPHVQRRHRQHRRRACLWVCGCGCVWGGGGGVRGSMTISSAAGPLADDDSVHPSIHPSIHPSPPPQPTRRPPHPPEALANPWAGRSSRPPVSGSRITAAAALCPSTEAAVEPRERGGRRGSVLL